MTLQLLSRVTVLLSFLALVSCTPIIEPESIKVEQVNTAMTGSMRGIHMISEKVVWISGSKGEFARTIDGGESWIKNQVAGAEALDFRDVHAFSHEEALLMSIGPGSASRIYRTTDGGLNWMKTFQNGDSLAFFDGMDFLTERHGFIVSDPVYNKPYILETINGGVSWNRLNPDAIPDLKEGEYAFAASGSSLDASANGRLFLATGGAVARVFRSKDVGHHWEVTSTPVLQGKPSSGLFSVADGPGNRVVAVGGDYINMEESGKNLIFSSDNGRSWEIPEGSKALPFMECVKWINKEALLAAGPPGLFFGYDGGKNWLKVSESGGHALDLWADSQTAWLVGNQGNVYRITWN